MNSLQLPANSRIPEEEAYGLDRSPPRSPTHPRCLALLLVPKSRAKINHEAGKSRYAPHAHPTIWVLLLIVMESHGEVEIRLYLNRGHCLLKICQWQAELQLARCMCPEGMELAADYITCMGMSCLCPRSGLLGPWAGGSSRAREGCLLCARHHVGCCAGDWRCISAFKEHIV